MGNLTSVNVLFGEPTNDCSQCSFRRVHISEVTSQFLSGEFELEPGDGESREDALRQAGIKSFLVKSVSKAVNCYLCAHILSI